MIWGCPERMRALVVLCVLFFFWGGSRPVVSSAEETLDCRSPSRWEAAARRLTSGEKLVAFLRKVTAACPGNLPILNVLGKLLLEQKRPEAAAKALRAGLSRTPGLIGSLLSASEAEVSLKDYRQALRLLWVARSIDDSILRAAVKIVSSSGRFSPIARLLRRPSFEFPYYSMRNPQYGLPKKSSPFTKEFSNLAGRLGCGDFHLEPASCVNPVVVSG